MWRRPVLHAEAEHGSVGWLELFFDVVFVVVLAVLAHDLGQHPEPAGLLDFVVQFAAVFWVWNAFTYYTERFESDGLEARLFTFLAMLAVGGLAVWGHAGLGVNYPGFVGSYLLARALNIGLWLRAGYHEVVFRPIARRFCAGYLLAAGLLAVALAGPVDPRRALFACAVLVEVSTPAATVRLQAALPPISRDKFPERFGLLTMIVLGETVAGVLRSLSTANETHRLATGTVLRAGLGLLLCFQLWWVYFDYVARRPFRPSFAAALGWVYLHLLALTAIVVLGVAIEQTLATPSHARLPTSLPVLLLGGAAASLLATALLELTLDRPLPPRPPVWTGPALKTGCALLLLASLTVTQAWSPSRALTLAVVILAVPVTTTALAVMTMDVVDKPRELGSSR